MTAWLAFYLGSIVGLVLGFTLGIVFVFRTWNK